MSISSATASPTIGRPELTRAIQDIATKAKKQLEETGSLAGFEADYKAVTGDGTITLSVSALAMRFYDKSAKPEDSLLAYKLGATNNIGDSVSGGTGSSLTIGDAEDVDAFAQGLVRTSYDLTIWQNDWSPEEVAAARGAAAAQAPAFPVADGGSSPTLDSRLTAFQQQQEATNRLVGALQDFLDGLRKSAALRGKQDPMDPTRNQQSAKNLLIRLDVTA
ncbi:MAG TPA: hypothetical protein VEC60_13630 [Reyranella sp.]|nr:hypothetical protein [Reyranella sp.]